MSEFKVACKRCGWELDIGGVTVSIFSRHSPREVTDEFLEENYPYYFRHFCEK